MSHFPIILIPPEIKQVKSAQPPVPVFEEPLPQRPGTPPQKLNATVIAVQTAVAVPAIPVVRAWTSIPEWNGTKKSCNTCGLSSL